MRQAWPQVESGRDLVDGWHLDAICEHLEAVYRGQIRNLIINCPPRMTKSYSVAVMFPAWIWTHSPEKQFLYTSYAQDLSVRDSRRCRALIQSRWFQMRWGHRFRIVSDQDTKIRFDNDRNGYRIASSVDGMATGEGGDYIVVDDANSVKDQSDTTLDTVVEWWRSTMSSRMNDFRTGCRVIIQQRTNEKDLTGYILGSESAKDYVLLRLPMEFEPDFRCITVPLASTRGKPWRDPRKEEGELLCPARMGAVEVASLKRSLGNEYAIAGQLQQRPAPAAGGIIKRDWIKLWKYAQPPTLKFILMSVDTAISAKKRAAFSAVTTWGIFEDKPVEGGAGVPQVILMSLWRGKSEYPELRARIQRMAGDYLDDGDEPLKRQHPRRPDIILVENKSSGQALIQDLHRAGVPCWPYNPDQRGDKIGRVRLVTPLLMGGRVWVPTQAPAFEKPRPYADLFIQQCISFPNAAARDVVDTMSQALDHLAQFGFVWSPENPDPPPPKLPEFVQDGQEAFY